MKPDPEPQNFGQGRKKEIRKDTEVAREEFAQIPLQRSTAPPQKAGTMWLCDFFDRRQPQIREPLTATKGGNNVAV